MVGRPCNPFTVFVDHFGVFAEQRRHGLGVAQRRSALEMLRRLPGWLSHRRDDRSRRDQPVLKTTAAGSDRTTSASADCRQCRAPGPAVAHAETHPRQHDSRKPDCRRSSSWSRSIGEEGIEKSGRIGTNMQSFMPPSHAGDSSRAVRSRIGWGHAPDLRHQPLDSRVARGLARRHPSAAQIMLELARVTQSRFRPCTRPSISAPMPTLQSL